MTNAFSFLKNNLFFLFLLSFLSVKVYSQPISTKTREFKNNVGQDSSRTSRHYKFDSTLFTDTSALTRADYLAALQRAFEIQNKVPLIVAGFTQFDEIKNSLIDDDSIIVLIKERLAGIGNRTINLQNLQTYQELLTNIQEDNEKYNKYLFKCDTTLDDLKRSILLLRKDTVFRHIFRDSVLRLSLMPQIIELRAKRLITDSLVKTNTTSINNLKAQVSSNSIAIAEMLFELKLLSNKATANAFAKDRKYLWEPATVHRSNNYSVLFQKKIETEKKITAYYFKNTKSNRRYLLLILVSFFLWVNFNFYSLKKRKKLNVIDKFNFQYSKPYPFFVSFLFVLVLAPLFDLNAPAVYSEFIEILTLIVLSINFFKKLPRHIFYYWCIFCLLFLTLPTLRMLGLPIYLERWGIFYIDITSVLFGLFVFIRLRKSLMPSTKHLLWAIALYTVLNFFSILCNLFGRVTLSNILHFAAVYTLAQIIALTIWARIVVEIILLQIASSRVRKNYPEEFDFVSIEKGLSKISIVTAIVIWLIYFFDNLNIFDILLTSLSDFLSNVRTIGSFSFTLGGVCLFLAIILIANFLQKYIGYLFGDTGEDFLVDNKKERSRLLITRLILLIVGFLLAVAASGLPVDRITIVLGALSIGIGLGLQNIVNNFVSGVILVFDRTLRIGDVVEVSDKKGRVKEIGLRASKLTTGDGAEIIIPNGDVLSHNIINWTLSNNHVQLNMSFTLQQPCNFDEISAILVDEILQNENVLTLQKPSIIVSTITANFVTLKVYFWCKNISKTETTYSQLNQAIYKRFEQNGIKSF